MKPICQIDCSAVHCNLFDIMNISTERLFYISTKKLGFRKSFVQYAIVSRRSKSHTSKTFSGKFYCFRNNKTDFLHWFCNLCETWVYHYDSESKTKTMPRKIALQWANRRNTHCLKIHLIYQILLPSISIYSQTSTKLLRRKFSFFNKS